LIEIPDRSADWLEPPAEEEGLRRYVSTVRERWLLIALTTLVTTAIAIVYVLTATKMYTAESDLLITPVAGEEAITSKLGLLTASSDPTRDVETAAKLITNVDVAQIAKEELKSDESADELLSKISATPVAQSNVIALQATATSAQQARELANTFARAAIEDRTNQMHEKIAEVLPQSEARLASEPEPETGAGTLSSEVAQLQTLSGLPDPTVGVAVSASLPSGPSSPKRTLSVLAGIIAGLILGIGGAFTAQALDPRLRREEQLRRRYRLPILARIPTEEAKRGAPLDPRGLSPASTEAYRTLRATLSTAVDSGTGLGRVILVTGSAPSEGKTTSAINLAAAFALAGKKTILIESDLRRPAVGTALGLQPKTGGILAYLIGGETLDSTLVSSELYGPGLKLLLADYNEGWIPELFSIPAAAEMIDEARKAAEYVIVDSPPLNEVADALPLARMADDVLLVTRIGRSRLDRVSQLGELLVENAIHPTGFVVVGAPRPGGTESSYYTREGEAGGRTLIRRPAARTKS
jgi:succinoglycan biosynthesis transport protein ExoP